MFSIIHEVGIRNNIESSFSAPDIILLSQNFPYINTAYCARTPEQDRSHTYIEFGTNIGKTEENSYIFALEKILISSNTMI